ncbi:MAG: methyltransferase domain-containing protein, partial [Pseudomonadota bacterium]
MSGSGNGEAATGPSDESGLVSAETAAEAAKFDAMGDEWRAADGAFAPLHAMQAVRLDYVREQIATALVGARGPLASARRPLAGVSVVDLGAGGGLASEPLARLGAGVIGVDPSERAIELCRSRAQGFGLPITYTRMDAAAAAAAARAGEAPFVSR